MLYGYGTLSTDEFKRKAVGLLASQIAGDLGIYERTHHATIGAILVIMV